METTSQYQRIIHDKLFTLERKYRLSAKNQQDSDKLTELYRRVKLIEQLISKLDNNLLTWVDLDGIGISKKSIIGEYSDFPYKEDDGDNTAAFLADIPQKSILSEDSYFGIIINPLYAIAEYININYQTIFTQKILVSANKTASIRELIYSQYLEVEKVFKSIRQLGELQANSVDTDTLMQKEYSLLLKAMYNFLTNMQNGIKLIVEDTTFTDEDFSQAIVSTDTEIAIYGLPLNIALQECKLFVNESLAYIISENKDFFDYLALDK